ncbi:hypothetical protein PFISCL1PPCAC_16818, partial [Pristionchus fissidentatus]
MGDGRQGRVEREIGGETNLGAEPVISGAPVTLDRVGGVSRQASHLERLYPYIRYSSYYQNIYRSSNLSVEKQHAPRNEYMMSRTLLRSSSSRDSLGMIRPSPSVDHIRDMEASGRKSVSFRQRIEESISTPPLMHKRLRAGSDPRAAHLRSILKREHASNLLKIANENMLRELEQCVEERDRLSVNICATPADVSHLSPMTQQAQTRYRNHMINQRERISVMIEDKHSLIKETLREDDMPSWLQGKDSESITLSGYKRHHRRLLRRQSSSFFYQAIPTDYRKGAKAADLVTANDCARKLERLRCQFERRDSEFQIIIDDDNAGDLLSRLSQRLSNSPIRQE